MQGKLQHSIKYLEATTSFCAVRRKSTLLIYGILDFFCVYNHLHLECAASQGQGISMKTLYHRQTIVAYRNSIAHRTHCHRPEGVHQKQIGLWQPCLQLAAEKLACSFVISPELRGLIRASNIVRSVTLIWVPSIWLCLHVLLLCTLLHCPII